MTIIFFYVRIYEEAKISFGRKIMLLSNNQYDRENDTDLLFERPVGWSSACLDSTIDYYLNYNYNNLQENENTDYDIVKD